TPPQRWTVLLRASAGRFSAGSKFGSCALWSEPPPHAPQFRHSAAVAWTDVSTSAETYPTPRLELHSARPGRVQARQDRIRGLRRGPLVGTVPGEPSHRDHHPVVAERPALVVKEPVSLLAAIPLRGPLLRDFANRWRCAASTLAGPGHQARRAAPRRPKHT